MVICPLTLTTPKGGKKERERERERERKKKEKKKKKKRSCHYEGSDLM